MKNTLSSTPTELRERAERQTVLRKDSLHENIESLPPADLKQLAHELQVHQIELEMQNEELRLAQTELEASRARYFDLYDLAPVGYCAVDEKGLIITANLTLTTMSAVPRSSLIKLPFSRLIYPEDTSIYYLFYKKLFASNAAMNADEEIHSCELRLLRKDESPCWVHIKATLVQDEEAGFVGRLVLTDISHLKQSELALKDHTERLLRSETRLKKAQSIARVGDWTWNLETKEVEWSDEMFRIFGIDKDSYTGRLGDAISSVIHPDDLHIVQPTNAPTFAERKPITYRILWPDASIRHIQAETGDVLLNASGKPILLTGTCQDITERVLSEQALRESEAMFTNAFEYAAMAKALLAPDGRWMRVNQALCRLLEYTEAELAHLTLLDLTHPDDTQASIENFYKLLNGEILTYQMEKRYLKKSGHIVWVLLSTSMTRDEKGQPKFIIVEIQDVSARKESEKTLADHIQLVQTVYDTTPEFLILKDYLSVYIEVNQAFCKFLGKTREEILGKTDYELFSASEAAALEASDRLAMRLGQYETEWVFERDQHEQHLHVLKSAVLGADQQCVGVLASIRDETERWELAQEIRASDERYRSSFQDSAAAMLLLDASNGQLLDANKTAENYYGYSREQLLRLNIGQINTLPTAQVMEKLKIAEREPTAFINLTHRLASGEIRDIDAYTSPITANNQNLIQVIIHDITQRKLADDIMKASIALHAHFAKEGLQGILQASIDLSVELTDSELGFISFVSQNQQNLSVQTWTNRNENSYPSDFWNNLQSMLTTESVLGDCIREGRALLLNDYAAQHPLKDFPSPHTPIDRYLIMPVFDGEKIVAIYSVANKAQDYRPRDVIFLQEFARASWDLVQIKKFTQAYIQSEEQMRSVLTATPEIVFSVNPDFKIEFINRVPEGLSLSDALGADALYFIVPDYQALLHASIVNVFQNGQTNELILQAQGNPDDCAWYECHLAPIFDQGKVKSVIITMMDITKQLTSQIALLKSSEDLVVAYDATLNGWSKALELRERETAGHSERVVNLTLELACVLGVKAEDLIHIKRGALLHDIGKIGIPDNILLKPGPLDEEEWLIMRRHPLYARQLLSPVTYLGSATDIPYYHHEKWDGTGYPKGLKGEEIPLSARIFAVVDVWDALSSDRPYRPAWDLGEVIKYIKNLSGKQFDPRVVDAFFSLPFASHARSF